MDIIYYFFEKDGLWLTDDRQLTNDPQKAWWLPDRLEAELFILDNETLKGFKVTQHLFMDNKRK